MSENKSLRRPVIDPLLIVLKSRRVIVAISALLVSLLVMAVPELVPLRDEILTMVITMALAVIGGYTVEEAARAGRERANLPPEELRELIKDVLNGMVDEVAEGNSNEERLPEAVEVKEQ
jgi:hypothetical protein